MEWIDEDRSLRLSMRSLFCIALLLAAAGVPIPAAHDGPHTGPTEETFKVGKDGRVRISEDLLVGTTVVKKGMYLFEHRVGADHHIVTLTSLGATDLAPARLELPMRLLPSNGTAKRTAIFAAEIDPRSLRMTMIELAGESGEHVLDWGGE
jgi:hypothetical protein